LIAALGTIAIWLWLFRGLPEPGTIAAARLAPSTILFDRKGRVLYEILDPYVGRHQPVSLKDIPP
jgi:membrane peptidoglycan carboxypeptidase